MRIFFARRFKEAILDFTSPLSLNAIVHKVHNVIVRRVYDTIIRDAFNDVAQ